MPGSKEAFAIKLSIYGSLIMAVTGIFAAIYGNSFSLLFDALNTLIATAISIAGLRISKLLKVEYSKRFNFGYYSFEPLFVLTNGLLMLILAVSLFISSVQTIMEGGRIFELTIVSVYLVFSFFICGILAIATRYYAKKTKSELLHTESINWWLDTLICIVVLFAFLVSLWLKNTEYQFLIPYLDPGITIILIIFFIYQPFKLIRSGVFGLLLEAPPKKVTTDLNEILLVNKHKYGFEEVKIHAAKVGRTTRLEILCYYNNGFEIRTIETLEQISAQIKIDLENYSQNMEVKVSFYTLHS